MFLQYIGRLLENDLPSHLSFWTHLFLSSMDFIVDSGFIFYVRGYCKNYQALIRESGILLGSLA